MHDPEAADRRGPERLPVAAEARIHVVLLVLLAAVLVGLLVRRAGPGRDRAVAAGHSAAPGGAAVGPRSRASAADEAASAMRASPGSSSDPTAASAPSPSHDAGAELAALAYVAIGGGSAPANTEVSLEQDLTLATETLAGPGVVLFAGGREALAVRIEDADAERTPAPVTTAELALELGDLFAPRPSRQSRYRRTHLPARSTSRVSVETTLSGALQGTGAPLLVYISAHGERGDEPADGFVGLWGDAVLGVRRLAELHEAHPRPLRLVVASCYSGGFAELAFAGADAKRGVTHTSRCGLFAGTWDRQTSGCDPNPDRRAQAGYSLHMLAALRGRDRDGRPIPLAELDLDGDGAVSLLEAHSRARIASRSFDVPTTTSERYLRELIDKDPSEVPRTALAGLLPEEHAVIDALGARLGLADATAARQSWRGLDARLRDLDERVAAADDALNSARSALSMRLLERWPVLDDAYHPDFSTTLEHASGPIRAVLRDSAEAHHHAEAQRAVNDLDAELVRVELDEAVALRLVRAWENLERASVLQRRNDASWRRYLDFLACERSVVRRAGEQAESAGSGPQPGAPGTRGR